MVSKKLVLFIQENVRKGYSIDEIKLHLVKSGYSTSQIKDSIDYYKKHYTPMHRIVLLFVFFAILSFVLVFSLLNRIYPVENAQQLPETAGPFSALPGQNKAQVQEQPQEKSQAQVQEQDEMAEIPARPKQAAAEEQQGNEMPAIAPAVAEKETGAAEKKPAETAAAAKQATLYPTPTYSIEEIKAVSRTDSERAVRLCEEHESRDACLNTVAKTSKNSNICIMIINSLQKDDCIMFFVYSGENLCSQLTSTNLKNACLLILQAKLG